MTERTITPADRSLALVETEISAQSHLVARRNDWLTRPENRSSARYDEVKRDTLQMIFRLEELQAERRILERKKIFTT